MTTTLTFPENFLWGTAGAAHQVEGNNYNCDSWVLEHVPSTHFAEPSGDACDHYHRFPEDVNIMAEIGLKAYRFSISWPRVIPAGKGKVNEKGLAFYDRLVDNLLEKQIIPFVTLYHWDLPQSLEDRGGWRNKDTAYASLISYHHPRARPPGIGEITQADICVEAVVFDKSRIMALTTGLLNIILMN